LAFLVVVSDDDGLVSFGGSDSGGALLAIDRVIISFDAHILVSSDEQSLSKDIGGVLEEVSKFSTFASVEGNSLVGPGISIKTDDSSGCIQVADKSFATCNNYSKGKEPTFGSMAYYSGKKKQNRLVFE